MDTGDTIVLLNLNLNQKEIQTECQIKKLCQNITLNSGPYKSYRSILDPNIFSKVRPRTVSNCYAKCH